MYGLTLRSSIAVWLVVSCSVAHASSMADYRIDTGDSIADQWVWMNASGGEALTSFTQIISPCPDQKSGSLTNFKRCLAIINEPSGGIAAALSMMEFTSRKNAVCKETGPTVGVKLAAKADRRKRERDGLCVDY